MYCIHCMYCAGAAGCQHVHVVNMTLAHTSSQFFLPHEETSGGDYAITRAGACVPLRSPYCLL